MIETTIAVGNELWRIKAKNFKAALNEIAHARVIGSVGSRTEIDNTLCGGTKELLAEVHKVDADGKDIEPS